jgi:hypothetical protein
MTRVFISYAHTTADTWLAERLELWLDRQGIDVWRDATSIRPGENFEKKIDEAIQTMDAMIFIVSPEWRVGREWTGWELERLAAHDPAGERITRIAIYRVPLAQLPQGPPARLFKYDSIQWEDGKHDDGACFWKLLCGLDHDRELGLEHTWSERGKPLVAELPVRDKAAAPPIPRKPRPRRPEKPSLECGRGDEWLMVQQMYSASHHQISVVAAQRHEAHETFVERIEKKLIANASPPIKRVDWPTRPINRQDYLECLVAALSPRGRAGLVDDLPKLFERLLAESNAILLHDLIDSRFDDEKLIRYYTEWLPELLPKNAESHRLKCVQPVAWNPAGGAMKLGRDLSSTFRLRGLSDWFVAPEERLARLFVSRLASAGQTVKSIPIDLTPIDEDDVLMFCNMKGIDGAAREEILRRTRRGGAIQTSEQVLAAIDTYFDEQSAITAGEPG